MIFQHNQCKIGVGMHLSCRYNHDVEYSTQMLRGPHSQHRGRIGQRIPNPPNSSRLQLLPPNSSVLVQASPTNPGSDCISNERSAATARRFFTFQVRCSAGHGTGAWIEDSDERGKTGNGKQHRIQGKEDDPCTGKRKDPIPHSCSLEKRAPYPKCSPPKPDDPQSNGNLASVLSWYRHRYRTFLF